MTPRLCQLRARRASAWGLAVAAAALLGACAMPEASRADLVIADVTVVSPERGAPLERAYVRIRDGRIAEVSARRLGGEQEIDGRGRYLIPGLIDTHVHLSGTPGMGRVAGMTAEQAAAHSDIAEAAEAQAPRSFLYFGFTTLLDLRGKADFITEWNTRPVRPDAAFCGPAPIPGGYSFGSYAESRYFLDDGAEADRIPASIDRSEHTPEAVVARMAADGAICVKTYFERGFAPGVNLPTPRLETIRAVVAAAHARGMPVFMHANSEEAQAFALDASVDVIAHGMWNGHQLVDDQLTDDVRTLLDVIAAKGVGYQPTAQVMRGLGELFDPAFLDQPELADAVPASLLAWRRTDEGGWFRREIEADIGDLDPNVIYPAAYHRLDRVISRLSDDDARLLFGTDTPSAPTYANPPGLNGLFEIRDWAAAGVSLEKLFHALTIDNARAIGLDGEIGTVEPGKIANLLLLDANPLENVEAYDAIDTVILHGRPIARANLSARAAASP